MSVLLEVWLALVTQQSGVFLPVVSYHKDKSEVTSYVREHTHFRTGGKMGKCVWTLKSTETILVRLPKDVHENQHQAVMTCKR